MEVLRHPDLRGDTVRVHYTQGLFGLVDQVHILAGPDATASHIRQHAQTARLMLQYQGVSGLVRVLIERVSGMLVPGRAVPRVGSRAWEAMLEVRKLPEIIDYRARTLVESADPEVIARATADLEYLRAQLERHQSTLDRWDLEQGVGYVAAEGSHHADAVAAGYPPLDRAPGHYYEPAEGGGYLLRQRAGSSDPPMRLAREGDRWVLREQTRAEAVANTLPQDLHQRLLAIVTATEVDALHQLLGDRYLAAEVQSRGPGSLRDLAAVAVELRNLATDPIAAQGLRRLREGASVERSPVTVADILIEVPPDRIGAFLTVVADRHFPVYQTNWLVAAARTPELLRFLESADGVARFNDLRRHRRVIEQFMRMIPGLSDAQVGELADRIQAAGRSELPRRRELGIGPPPPPPPLPADLQLAVTAIDAQLSEASRWAKEHANDPDNLASEQPFLGTDAEVRAYAEALARIEDVRTRTADYQARTHAERLDLLDRFEQLLRQPGFTFKTTWINNLRGALSERLFIPHERQVAKTRFPHPGGGFTILDYALAPGDPAPHAPPDSAAPGYTRWVEQKSDLITAPPGRTDVYAPAVARARKYAADAALDYRSLANTPGHGNDMIFIEFVRPAGNQATEAAMLRELFGGTPPIQAARFGGGPWIERAAWLAANPPP